MANVYYSQLILQTIYEIRKELENQTKILQNISEKLSKDNFENKEKENDNL